MKDPLLEEIYEIREKIWKRCGGTLEGLSAYCSRPIPGVLRSDLKPVKPHRHRASSLRAASRKKPARP